MLNTLDMYGICHEIYRDLKGKMPTPRLMKIF